MTPVKVQFSCLVGIAILLSLGTACSSSGGCDPQDPASLSSFTDVDIDSAVTVNLTVDSGSEQKVEVVEGTTVTTCVSDEVLYINKTGDEWPTNVSVNAPELDSVNVKSASNLTATGATDSYKLTLSSASGASAEGLTAKQVSVDFSKESSGQINASDAVDGVLAGDSNLTVSGGADTSGVEATDGTISTG